MNTVGKIALSLLALGGIAVVVPASADRAGIALMQSGPFALSAHQITVTRFLRDPGATDPARADAALAAAEAIVARAPLRRGAVSLLAAVQAKAGQGERAAQTFAVAAGHGWRDVAAQAWAIDQALDAGEADIAALRMEALLRAAPSDAATAAMLDAVAADPRARARLAEAMARAATGAGAPGEARTGWTAQVLAQAEPARAVPSAGRLALLAEARAAGFRPDAQVARRRTHALYETDPARAWAFWLAAMGPGDAPSHGVWSSDFAALRAGRQGGATPFEWRRDRTGTARLDVQGEGPDARLSITGGVGVIAETLARTAVAVTPGRYALSWRASRAPDGTPEAMLRATCARPARDLPVSAIVDRAEESAQLVTVPAGCSMMDISVFLPSSGDADRWLAEPVLRKVG